MSRTSALTWLKPLAFPLVLIACWEISVRVFLALGGSSPKLVILPLPTQIFSRLAQTISEGSVMWDVFHTLFSALLGFSLGILGAVMLGSLLGISRWAETYITPTLHFLRSLPVVLYVPITLLLIGADLRAPVFLAALVTTLYGAIPVIRAVRDYDPEKILFLRARSYTTTPIVLRFILPEIIAALSTSISISITLALAIAVVAEMLLPGLGGLGAQIIRSKEVSNYESLWALTFLLGGCGFLFHDAVLRFWRLAAPWTK
jgi:sulfonate transport system permease protein